MSTKIWKAQRVPIPMLNDYLKLCRVKTMGVVAHRVKTLIEAIDWELKHPETIAEGERNVTEWNVVDVVGADRIRMRAKLEYLVKRFKEASLRSERSLFDYDSSFNIWLDKEYAYLIPYGLASFAETDYAEDYRYQNQTDKPEEISMEEWDIRAEKWDELCLDEKLSGGWNMTRLQYDILNFKPDAWIQSQIELEDALGVGLL